MQQFSNRDKQAHGKNAKNSLEDILKQCESYSYIKEIIKGFRCGFEGFDDEQFYCNFIIVFLDDTKWIINITNTFRSDRVKGNQWDSYNIKKIIPEISKSILVYPDGIEEKEREAFKTYKLKVENNNDLLNEDEKNIKKHFSAIDYIVGQNELFELIESYAYKDLSLGSRKGKQGNNFESYISSILNNKDNLTKWKTDNPVIVGSNYDIFIKIVNCFKLNKNETLNINASSDKTQIGKLKENRNPKTDINVVVTSVEGYPKSYTISCKKTEKNEVAVHEYNANTFSEVLDPNNIRLRDLLILFQSKGSLDSFGAENVEALTIEIKPYIKKLVYWVLRGFEGHSIKQIQLADYILMSDGKNIYMHSVEEYTNELLKPENKRNFGTPFGWTYPSGKRGHSIKLKCKVIKNI